MQEKMQKAAPLATYNLIDEAWVPVLMHDGTVKELSLMQVFEQSNDIREISGDIPQQSIALIRLLLAILYRAYADEDETMTRREVLRLWEDTWSRGSFDMERVREYLERWRVGFDLFGPHPFFQVPGLQYEAKDKEFDSITELIVDVPKEDKFLFSMRARGSVENLSFAESARWLVLFQGYDISGIKTPVAGNTHAQKGKVYPPKGLQGIGWMGSIGSVCVESDSLFRTLMLNWVLYDPASRTHPVLLGVDGDAPPWEAALPASDYAVRSPFGIASLYTWQSRRMRMVPTDDGARMRGFVSCFGDIVRPTETPDFEQMTAWRLSKEQQKKLGTSYVPRMPVVHDCGRALWRGLGPLLSQSLDGGSDELRPGVLRWHELVREECPGADVPRSVTVRAQGMAYGPQSSSFADSYDDSICLGSALARRDAPAVARVLEVVDATDKAVYQLVLFVRDVERLTGDKRQGGPADAMGSDIRSLAYAELDDLFRSRVSSFSEGRDEDEYAEEWRREVHRRLLRMMRGHVRQAGVSSFAQRPIQKTGSVDSLATLEAKFRYQLNKLLGALPRLD